MRNRFFITLAAMAGYSTAANAKDTSACNFAEVARIWANSLGDFSKYSVERHAKSGSFAITAAAILNVKRSVRQVGKSSDAEYKL